MGEFDFRAKWKALFQSGAVCTALLLLFSVAGGMSGALVEEPNHLFKFLLALTVCLCGMFAMYWKSTGTLTEERLVFLLFLLAATARLCYILSNPITTNQHDTSWFGNPKLNNGHTGYIQYLMDEKHLPDFDVRTRFQFYHPPLHHIVCALWLKFQLAVGLPFDMAAENLQVLTLFYSLIALYASYRVLRQIGLHGIALIAPFCLIAFHPTFFLLSGSINNDCMSVMFCLLAVWAMLGWMQKPTFPRIVALALCIGCAMFAKLGAGVIAPAVAVLFLCKFFKTKGWSWKKRGKSRLLVQFCLFGAICIPLGIGWEVRNLLLFDVPLTYVPRLSKTIDQYLGDYPVWTRFFDFKSLSDFGVYPMRTGVQDAEYFEHCIPLALQKMALFGEYSTWKNNGLYDAFGRTLFWANAAVILTTLIGMLLCVISVCHVPRGSVWEAEAHPRRAAFYARNGFGRMPLLFLLLYWFSMLFSYVQFCFSYPHFCSMDFRYIVPTILIGAVFFGVVLRRLDGRSGKVALFLRTALLCCTIVFSVCSTLIYPFVFGV